MFSTSTREKLYQILHKLTSLIILIGDVFMRFLINIGTICIGVYKIFKMLLLHTIRILTNLKIYPSKLSKKVLPKNLRIKINVIKKIVKQIFFRLKFISIGIIIASLVFLLILGNHFIKTLPNPQLIGKVNYPVSTKIFDRKGRLLYQFHKDQDRTPIAIDQLPVFVWQATVAIEDKNYFSHNGISIINGMLRAAKDSLKTGHIQGGSTITQQLIKTALLSPERTIDRKIREIILALWAERIYTKRQILEMYLNQVPYGGSSYGIEAASKTYFGKSAHDLTISEAAFLAGLPQAPSYYSPYIDKSKSLKRRNDVLKAMHLSGYITDEQYDSERNVALEIRNPDTYIKAPHFVFFVKSYLDKLFGLRYVEEGGLRVTTSLDLDLQQQVEKLVSEEIESLKDLHVGNGAVLVTRPSSGQILAMVGSKDYYQEPYGSYNVTTALRQPGSSIKPLMYSLALMRGYTAASVIDDSPISFGGNGSPVYSPENYDSTYHGRVPLRYALANSYNIPAVKVLNTLGVNNFIDHAQKLGISTFNDPSRYGLSITLGGAEVKLIDMSVAYGVFANYGKRVELNPVINVKDFQGNDLYDGSFNRNEKNVLPEGVAFIISSILSDNKARESSFGPNSQLVIPGHVVAVKTGTTNSKRDNLTIGYTRDFLTAVWVGNNDNSPMDQQLVSGVTGAAPIWNRVMTHILDSKWDYIDIAGSGFPVPDSVIEKKCFFNTSEYFIKGSEEGIGCDNKELGR